MKEVREFTHKSGHKPRLKLGLDRVIQARRFRFNWKVTAFSVFFLALFIHLGLWQLSRAAEKRQLLAQAATQAALPPVPISEWMSSRQQGRQVQLVGSYVSGDYWLLDNRVLDGRVGFEVIHRFAASDQHFFINRGFAPMGATRSDLPEVKAPSGRVTILALARQPTEDAYVLGGADESEGRIIQSLADLPIDADIAAPVMRLGEASPGALPRHWPITTMSPQKHQGYALQWFTLALAVSLAWAVFTFPIRTREGGTTP